MLDLSAPKVRRIDGGDVSAIDICEVAWLLGGIFMICNILWTAFIHLTIYIAKKCKLY